MTDRKALPDKTEPPEDVASLYSWANLHGAKYKDFSVARAQTREKARQRVQEAIEEERARTRQQAEPDRSEPGRPSVEPQPTDEQAHLAELAHRLTAQLAAHRVAEQAAEQSEKQGAPKAPWHQPGPETYAPPSGYKPQPPPPRSGYQGSQGFYQPPYAPAREAPVAPSTESKNPPERREAPVRPAWITDRPEPPPPSAPQPSDDTIQGSRDRLTSRWFALKTVLEGGGGTAPAPESAMPAANQRTPVVGVFSLAGGVGKTSLVATLGRALSARGERVLLVDTAPYGLLPFFFGARDQRPGQLRTFTPPAASGDSPIQMIAIDPEALGPENASQEVLIGEIAKHTRGVSRIIIDLATASGSTARRILKLSPLVLVPVMPDMNSVVSVGSIDTFFERNVGATGKLPYYVLNQFDPSLPLHLDVREVLREQLSERLLSFALRRAPAVSEALAEGMTVMDYAPNSTVTEDFGALAGWIKNLSAPASVGFRGVRWSER